MDILIELKINVKQQASEKKTEPNGNQENQHKQLQPNNRINK